MRSNFCTLAAITQTAILSSVPFHFGTIRRIAHFHAVCKRLRTSSVPAQAAMPSPVLESASGQNSFL
jgi:hypothetical protein